MQCKCGGLMTQQTHYVTTTQGVSKWTDKAVKLPARIDQNKCLCARTAYTVSDERGIIDSRG